MGPGFFPYDTYSNLLPLFQEHSIDIVRQFSWARTLTEIKSLPER